MKIQSSRKISNKKITGQGMSEYLVIVGLLAVAGIATMGFMGKSVRGVFGSFSHELSGDAQGTGVSATAKNAAQGDATSAVTSANSSLKDYEVVNANL